MFILANLIGAIGRILDIVITIFTWLIIARALISWVNPDPYNFIVRFLQKVTEPILYPIRKRLPFGWGIDISPIIAILGFLFLRYFLVRSLLVASIKLAAG